MTPTECVDLVELITHLCPAQAVNAGTPDAWFPLLQDVPLADAIEAVYASKRAGSRFVDVTDVLDGVAVIHRARLDAAPEPAPPSQIADDPVAYRAWLADHRAAAAAGHNPLELNR
jgi:hypothetical protein